MTETTTAQMGLFESAHHPKDIIKEPAQKNRITKKQRNSNNTPTETNISASLTPENMQPNQTPNSQRKDLGRSKSGLVPEGDIRLTANVKEEIHLRLKLVSVHRRTTIGEIIEELVEKYLESPYVIKK